MADRPLGRIPTGKLIKFLASGLPAFSLAVPLNYLLVERVHLHYALAYGVVLFFQITVNFLICKHFVFPNQGTRHWLVQFWQLGTGSLGFRVLEWGVYSLAVRAIGRDYIILLQLGNVALFMLPKFFYARRVMEK